MRGAPTGHRGYPCRRDSTLPRRDRAQPGNSSDAPIPTLGPPCSHGHSRPHEPHVSPRGNVATAAPTAASKTIDNDSPAHSCRERTPATGAARGSRVAHPARGRRTGGGDEQRDRALRLCGSRRRSGRRIASSRLPALGAPKPAADPAKTTGLATSKLPTHARPR